MTADPPVDLQALARESMRERGFVPEFPPSVLAEVRSLEQGRSCAVPGDGIDDLRELPWSSIDNDDTRDLDQLCVAEPLPDGVIRVLVAIADVDALVPRDSATDRHAAANTTSVYTGVETFPMLPRLLSEGLTSLHEGVDRLAVVVALDIAADGEVRHQEAYRAVVRNRAQLVYEDVAAWLEERAPLPKMPRPLPDLEEQLRIQDSAARALRSRRASRGALELSTPEARPVVRNGKVVGLEVTRENRARELIEDFMIAVNVASAQILEDAGRSSIRRVVHTPARWPRLVQLAEEYGETLPEEPDTRALCEFLQSRRREAPERFPDLSLSVVKLLGAGDYRLERPGEDHGGHFALAVQDYAHTTAPNRRYADLVMQRLLKALLAGDAAPYSDSELTRIAERCTLMEDQSRRVERQVRKAAATTFLLGRIGDRFDAIVTGASSKGTWVRVLDPPVEGRVVRGESGLDVGDRVRVELVRVEPSRGFIDFARSNDGR